MPLNSTQQHFTKLYLASLLRAPDLGGLNYWSNEVLVHGKSLQAVGGIIFSLPVVTAIYPGTLSDLDFVEAIYENVFGRASDAEGLNYWANEIATLHASFAAQGSGNAAYEARGQLVMNMINAGLGTPEGTDGKAYIENRLEVAEYAVEKQLMTGVEIPPATLLAMESEVDATSASVLQGKCLVESLYDTTEPIQIAVIESVNDDVGSTTGMITNNGTTDDTSPLLGGVLSAPLALCETLEVSRDGMVIGNALVTGTSWSYADSGLSNGLHSYSVRVVDLAGNQGVPSAAYRIQVDTGALSTLVLSLAQDSGSSSSDGLTNNGTVNVSNLEAGATWEYSTNGGTSWTAGTGTSLTLTGDGAESVIARQTDAAGNLSPTSAPLSLILDTTVALPSLSLAQDAGSSSSDGLTNNGTVNVGNLEASATWEYSTNGGTSWTTGTGTSFTLSGDDAKSVMARQTDAAGNLSSNSTPLAFNLDTVRPELTYASVNGNQLVLSYNEALNYLADAAASSFGVLVDGAPVSVLSVNAGGTGVELILAIPVIYGQNITLSYTPPASTPTEDRAGNDALALSAWIVVNTTGDAIPPAAPSLLLVQDTGSSSADGLTNNGTVNVSHLEAGATWEYSSNGGTSWTAGTGTSVTLSGDGAKVVLARQTDAAGNVSLNSTALGFTLDTNAPTLSSATVVSTVLTLTFNQTLNAAADPALSSFIVNIAGTPVTVTSADTNGNTVILELDRMVAYGQSVTLDYTPPVTNPTQDMAGNTVVALTGLQVNNLAPAPDPRSGTLITDFFGSQDAARALGVQADGRIVLAGYADNGSSDLALARYNTDGSLDVTFDSDGKLTTNFFTVNSAGSSDAGYGLTLLADGKMLVGGYAYNGSNGYNFALAKYNSNGSLDTGFDADGKLVTDIAGSAGAEDKGFSLAVDANGKILLAGYSSVSGNSNFTLVRYNSNGSLDTSFDVDGKLTTDISGSLDEGHGIALQADGKILVSGFAYTASDSYDFALVRYNTDGSLDTGFDTDGKLTTDFAGTIDYGYSVTVQNDQKILVAGYTYGGSDSYDFALVRYNTDGSLDASFAANGKLITDFAGAQDFANKIFVQSNGKIIVAGNSFNGSDYDFALARYNANGSLDTSFGSGGKVSTDLAATNEYGFDVIVDANGKIIVAGYSFNGSHNDFALARYNSDGSLDVGNFGHFFLASGDNAERLILTASSSDKDVVNTYFGKSTQANLDTLEAFTLGSDAIHLANALTKPTSLVRVADIVSSNNLADSLSASFSGVVGANASALVVIQSGLAAGTYLYANDGNAAYSVLDDVFVHLVGLQGALGSVGTLAVNDFFV